MNVPIESADVVIVGGGPAGSSLGCLLAAVGIEAVILDRAVFPRPKPCGECINPGGVSALERIGLLEAVLRQTPARIVGWDMTTASGRSAHGGYTGRQSHGLGISRTVLDEVLVTEARRRGVRVVERTKIVDLAVRDDGLGNGRAPVTLKAVRADGRPVVWRAGMVVGADGLRSVVARRLGLVRRRPRIRKISFTFRLRGTGPRKDRGALFFSDGGTLGLAPVHGRASLWNATVVRYAGRWSRAAAADPRGHLVAALRHAPFPWDEGHPEIVDGPWASGPFDSPTRRAVADATILIGDAAGYFDPLTGQGLCRAFRSAELAAPVIARAVRSGRVGAVDLLPYQRGLRRMLRSTRALQRVIELVVSHRATQDFSLGYLQRSTPLADRLVQVIGDAMPVHSLVEPELLLSLLPQAA